MITLTQPPGTLRGFWFPGQPGDPVAGRDGVPHDPAAAKVQLADVPFVPLSRRLRELLPAGRPSTSFHTLVKRYREAVTREDSDAPVAVIIDTEKCKLTIEDVTISISGDPRFGVILALLKANADGVGPVDLPQAFALCALFQGVAKQEHWDELTNSQRKWLKQQTAAIDNSKSPKWAKELTDSGIP